MNVPKNPLIWKGCDGMDILLRHLCVEHFKKQDTTNLHIVIAKLGHIYDQPGCSRPYIYLKDSYYNYVAIAKHKTGFPTVFLENIIVCDFFFFFFFFLLGL